MSHNLGLRFYEIARKRKDNVCLKYLDNRHYTFFEVDQRSNQLARWMISNNIKRGSVVGLFNNKSFDSFSVMIACLKTGIIYTNLDPFSPLSRLQKITDRCTPTMFFSDFEKGGLAPELEEVYEDQTVRFGTEAFSVELSGFSKELLEETNSVCGTDPAYIMFTSGSTGFPKGAVMTHANLISFLDWSIDVLKPKDTDVFTNVNPIYFDNSVFDFYSAVYSGTPLAPFTFEVTKNPATLVKSIDAMGCTIWFSVPSLLVYLLTTRMLNKDNMKNIRMFVFGGEGFPKPKLKELFDLYNERAVLLNVYGPTECTCICSQYFISKNDFQDMTNLAPLGKLTKNFFHQVVDENMKPAMKGEMLLGGPNVGSGYFNDQERSASVFIQNPRHNNYRDIMYRTGDLVEKDRNGVIHFKGRIDNQIKHMGYRIELEEIESGLNTLHGVKEAAVIYKSLGPGMGQIIAFVASDLDLEGKDVLNSVKRIVPDYMVPRKVTVVRDLPKNQNGKIDRNAL